jgi:hypothetical protein
MAKRMLIGDQALNPCSFIVTPQDEVAGFGIRIGGRCRPNYYTHSGHERRFTIGGYPDWIATAARAEASRLRRRIDEGADPLADIEAERAAILRRFMRETPSHTSFRAPRPFQLL